MEYNTPMAMNKSALRSKMHSTIINGMRREFNMKDPAAIASVSKFANALADIAMDIVEEIVNNAEVNAEIPVAVDVEVTTTSTPGTFPGKGSGTTTAKGKVK